MMATAILTEKEDAKRKSEENKSKKRSRSRPMGKSQQGDKKTCIGEDTCGENKTCPPRQQTEKMKDNTEKNKADDEDTPYGQI